MLVHPHLFLSTKQARGILKREVTMSDFIWQTANLAGFISGCYTNDLDMIRASFEDVVIEKQRSQLIPGFDAVRKGAIDAGALGCTISGAGPTMFAWALEGDAEKVRAAMVARVRRARTCKWITGSCPSRPRARTCCRAEPRMKFISTRGQSPAVSFGAGACPGPRAGRRPVHARDLADAFRCAAFDGASTLPEVAEVMLRPFVDGDPLAARDRRHRARCLQFSGAARAGGR